MQLNQHVGCCFRIKRDEVTDLDLCQISGGKLNGRKGAFNGNADTFQFGSPNNPPGSGNAFFGHALGMKFFADHLDERLQGEVGESDLDLFKAIAHARLHGKNEEDGVRGGSLKKAAVVFVAQEDRAELFHFGPVVAPLADDDLNGLIKKGNLDLAEITGNIDGVTRAAHKPVDDGQAQTGIDVQDANSAHGLNLEHGQVGWIGDGLGKFEVRYRLQFGHLQRELHAQID